MNIFAWIKDQFSLTHNDQCTHCGKQCEVTEISWFYAAYSPRINYPLKRRSIHDNWLCESCMSLCFDNYFDPIGTIKKYRESLEKEKAGIK